MNNTLDETLTAIGAIIELAAFIRDTMIKNGFAESDAVQTAQEFILLKLDPDGE